jgi:hypothetical protein
MRRHARHMVGGIGPKLGGDLIRVRQCFAGS